MSTNNKYRRNAGNNVAALVCGDVWLYRHHEWRNGDETVIDMWYNIINEQW